MYELMKLNYEYGDLEPYIDEKTVEIHYGKHHQNYLNKVNAILSTYNFDFTKNLEDVIVDLNFMKSEDKNAFLFNAGGVLNHNLYFSIMSSSKNIFPVGKIKEAIDRKFGSFDQFKKDFIEMANSVMGSGWVFLVVDENKELQIVKTSNQETPLLNSKKPIIGIDLWEHAYYLKYQNLRPEYINNFFSVIDFEIINKMYEEII